MNKVKLAATKYLVIGIGGVLNIERKKKKKKKGREEEKIFFALLVKTKRELGNRG